MAKKEQYLDYEGLKTYHSELVDRLKDLEYDPSRMFADKTALLTLDNWDHDTYGRVFGLKNGLLVTVADKIWQLEDAAKFRLKLTSIGETPAQKSSKYSMEELGWKIVGNTVDFDVNGHILQLTK